MRRILVAVALAAIGLAPAPAAAQTTYKCLGETATVVGTEGDDRPLFGTAGDDVMVGLAGNDYIPTGGQEFVLDDGDDLACGGTGNDDVFATAGKM